MMYRVAAGALDEQISQVIAAIGHAEHLRTADANLAEQERRLRRQLGDIAVARTEREFEQSRARLSLSRLWAILRGATAEKGLLEAIDQADADIAAVTLERELQCVVAQRADIAEQLVAVAGAAEHLEELLVQKEAWLASTEGPEANELFAIAEAHGHWTVLEECIAAVVEIASDAQSELLQALRFYEDAHDPLSRLHGSETGISKAGQLGQASFYAAMADMHCRSLDAELTAIDGWCQRLRVELPAPFSVPVRAEARPETFGGVSVDGIPEVSGRELRDEAERVSRVVTAASVLREQVLARLAVLSEQRCRLLGVTERSR